MAASSSRTRASRSGIEARDQHWADEGGGVQRPKGGVHRRSELRIVVGLAWDVLDLDVQGAAAREQRERLGQRRGHPRAPPRGTDPQPLDLREVRSRTRPRPSVVRIHDGVVHHHRSAVAAHPYVELDRVGTRVDRRLERRQACSRARWQRPPDAPRPAGMRVLTESSFSHCAPMARLHLIRLCSRPVHVPESTVRSEDEPMEWIERASLHRATTPTCSSRSGPRARPSHRPRERRRSATPCRRPRRIASNGRWTPARTPACGAASTRRSDVRSAAAGDGRRRSHRPTRRRELAASWSAV